MYEETQIVNTFLYIFAEISKQFIKFVVQYKSQNRYNSQTWTAVYIGQSSRNTKVRYLEH